MAKTMKYTLQDFTNITFEGFNFTLPEETIKIIISRLKNTLTSSFNSSGISTGGMGAFLAFDAFFFGILSLNYNRNIKKIICKVFFNHESLVSTTNYKVIDPIKGIIFHNMPKNRFSSYLNQRFRLEVCFLGDASAETARQENNLHGFKITLLNRINLVLGLPNSELIRAGRHRSRFSRGDVHIQIYQHLTSIHCAKRFPLGNTPLFPGVPQ